METVTFPKFIDYLKLIRGIFNDGTFSNYFLGLSHIENTSVRYFQGTVNFKSAGPGMLRHTYVIHKYSNVLVIVFLFSKLRSFS